MKCCALLALAACLAASVARGGELNLATLSCDKYENEILASRSSPQDGGPSSPDSINTVMWLFGYSVAKSGEHLMYGDALSCLRLRARCGMQEQSEHQSAGGAEFGPPEARQADGSHHAELRDVRIAARGHGAQGSGKREYHHDVAVRLLGGPIRQPSIRCERAAALRVGAAGALQPASGGEPVRRIGGEPSRSPLGTGSPGRSRLWAGAPLVR